MQRGQRRDDWFQPPGRHGKRSAAPPAAVATAPADLVRATHQKTTVLTTHRPCVWRTPPSGDQPSPMLYETHTTYVLRPALATTASCLSHLLMQC